MLNIVYGLRDPRNDVYQYIGKSTVGIKQPLQHLTLSHSPQVNEWIEMLSQKWLYPIIDIIEEVVDIDDLADREKYWINYYHDINPELLNTSLVESELQHIRTEEDENNFNKVCSIIIEIPNIIKKERLYRNITQTVLAKEAGVARSTLSLCERGSNVNYFVIKDCLRTLKGIDIIRKSFIARTSKKPLPPK